MRSESLIEGLTALADEAEHRQRNYPLAIKCLESIVQSGLSLLPLTEIRSRLRLSSLLLSHTHNLTHARSHLERAHLLLSQTPASSSLLLPLKLQAHSLLSRCYHLIGSIPPQRHALLKALSLLRTADVQASLDPRSSLQWSANLQSQLAAALTVDADYPAALAALDAGAGAADELNLPDLQMFFAASTLHVHLIHWDDPAAVESAIQRCSHIWDSTSDGDRERCPGLFFYHELLQTFYLLRICDLKGAAVHVDRLDAAVKEEVKRGKRVREIGEEIDLVSRELVRTNLHRKERAELAERKERLEEEFREAAGFEAGERIPGFEDRLRLAPPPLDGEWLPRSAVYALVDLMTVMLGRPKGVFKECGRRIQSGMSLIHGEL